MLLEHHVSGYDFVRAMLLAGWRIVGTTLGRVIMTKEGREIVVPQLEVLPDDRILHLLERAAIPPLQFVTLLHRLGSRDTWPDPEEATPRARRG